MVKKFNFNFRFWERFKKKKNTEEIPPEEMEVENLSESNHSDIVTPPLPTEAQMSSDEIIDSSMPIEPGPVSPTPPPPPMIETEFEGVEKSEEFAEKTLTGIKIPLDELYESNQLENENLEHEIHPDHIPDFSPEALSSSEVSHAHNTHEEIIATDAIPPEKPKGINRFNFKFPKFGRENFTSINKIKALKFSDFDIRKFDFKNSFSKIEKVSWNDIILKIFSPYSRPRIHTGFIVLFIITFTYLFGKTIAVLINRTNKIDIRARSTITVPQNNQSSIVTDLNKISSTNLFNVRETEDQKAKVKKVDISQIHCIEADKPTTKQLKLLDTIVLQDSVKSVASVQVRGAADLLNIREGETLDGSEVSKIERMKLILKNLDTGDCEYLASEREDEAAALTSPITILPASAAKNIFKSMNPNIKNEGNNFKIKCKYRDDMVTKMSDILTQAKAVQISNPDGTLCFKMTEIVPGSIYSNLNIQENDIICQVNGKKIDNLNELMGLLGRIKDIDAMQISLNRNGSTENLDYAFDCK